MLNDLRHAARLLAKSPGFTSAAVFTLAAGISLNVSVFAIVNVLLLKPLPVQNPRELVWISGRSVGAERGPVRLTLPDVVDLRTASGVRDVLAFGEARMALRSGEEALRVNGQIVSGNYFSVLGVPALIGRPLTAEDDRTPGGHPVAVIAFDLCQRLFAGRTDAIGQEIQLNGATFTVVGVAPRGFRGPDILEPADVWVPLSMTSQVAAVERPNARNSWWLRAIARLAPGVDPDQAAASLRGVAAGIARAYPDSHRDFSVALDPLRGVNPQDRRNLSALALLPAVPLAVLLIACANVASLLLARGIARQREIAVRIALGASRARLMRQLLVESALLASLGGACSFVVSLWAPELLVRLAGAPVLAEFSPDARTVLFTAIVSLATAIAFGLVPSIRASRLPSMAALRGEPGAGDSGSKASRLQRVLVAGQLALSLILLMAAGLFVESILEAGRAPTGFETASRVTLTVDLRMQRYTDERAAAFYRSLLERAASTPGIRGATLVSDVPLGGRVTFMPAYPAGRPIDPDAPAITPAVNAVGRDFFTTLQLPILRGRPIAAADERARAQVAVVNETMASLLWPGTDPIGQRIILGDPDAASVEVVGVAADTLLDEFGEPPRPLVYLPLEQRAGEVSLIAWTDRSEAGALRDLESAVRGIDPAVAIYDPKPMSAHLAGRMDGERGLSRMLAVSGVLALGLAAFGLYGVTAYLVTRRTREIGVRVALGARPQDIVRLFVGEGARLAALGLVAGVLPAIGVTVLLSNVLFGVHPADPRALVAASAMLVLAAVGASYIPARRALRVDPVVALRIE